ncbi:MAG: TIGR00159 family protein [Lachnospiraceae bacterium]|nr:TIGR00159 family protein [Lachnospiraceae bacterium]
MFWINRPNMTATDLVEILIIAFLLYHILVWFKTTRAWTLFKGILVIVIFILIAAIFQMNTILWIADKTINVGIIAILVIFQPEMRKALEQLGRKRFISLVFSFDVGKNTEERYSERTVNEIVKACYEMGKVKTGALIVVEKEVELGEFERTGIEIDSVLTRQILINIFEKNTPLHDGAVILRGNRIAAATCYLPLSDNLALSKDLGTRHRAAVGVSEVSDSLTIVVSEETGSVSLAVEGRIYRDIDEKFLKEQLMNARGITEEPGKFIDWKKRLKNVKKVKRSSD